MRRSNRRIDCNCAFVVRDGFVGTSFRMENGGQMRMRDRAIGMPLHQQVIRVQGAAALAAFVEQDREVVEGTEMVRSPAQHVVIGMHRIVEASQRAEDASALEGFFNVVGIEDELELQLFELQFQRQPRIMRGKISRRRRYRPWKRYQPAAATCADPAKAAAPQACPPDA